MMGAPTYDKNKYYRIMDRTQSNYANQLKRLIRSENRSNFILIYYSLFLIISPLTAKFYPNLFDEQWISYSGIILSTVVLIYSIVNSKADYTNRISKIQAALNTVKTLKREVGGLQYSQAIEVSENGTQLNEFERIKKKYDEIVCSTEVRDDLDFFQTIRQLCKRYGLNHMNGKKKTNYDNNSSNDEIEEVLGYIAEINPLLQWFKIIIISLFHIIIYLIPIVILGIGFLVKLFTNLPNI